MLAQNLEFLDPLIERLHQAGRIPGFAIAIVADGATIFARGYGHRDAAAKLPMSAATIYPIASTSKAFNATLLGMLVDEGKVAWDAPVQMYLPSFRLGDATMSAQITLRDLLTMRTGLPRHDWMWIENPIDRAEMAGKLRHLALSAGFRERFQYNNLTASAAGHVAELVTGCSWEELVRVRILEPLEMSNTGFELPTSSNTTLSYHETSERELVLTQRLRTAVTAPSGGSIHSTVEDMARWVSFNLNGGAIRDRALIRARTLAEIHTPQLIATGEPGAPTPHAAYAFGWFVDAYNGIPRVSHGGYLHDVNSEVILFPTLNVGLVAFSNFGPPTLARSIMQHAFDTLLGRTPAQSFEETLAEYERKVVDNQARFASLQRVPGTAPSRAVDDYIGTYAHAGYGQLQVSRRGAELWLRRHQLLLPLEHWHYDMWRFLGHDLFPIHKPNPFDRASAVQFETGVDGDINALQLQLEPAVAPVRFAKLPLAAK